MYGQHDSFRVSYPVFRTIKSLYEELGIIGFCDVTHAVCRTIESLYEELVTEGIIVRYPKTSLSEYEGEYSYLGTTLRQASIEPMPSISDVRRLVAEFAILPLG